AARREANKQRGSVARCPAGEDVVLMRVVGEARLVGHVHFPADVLRVGAALNRAPLLKAPSDHGRSVAGALIWTRTVSAIDKRPGVCRIAQDLINHIVGWLAPQQPSGIWAGSLQARQ